VVKGTNPNLTMPEYPRVPQMGARSREMPGTCCGRRDVHYLLLSLHLLPFLAVDLITLVPRSPEEFSLSGLADTISEVTGGFG